MARLTLKTYRFPSIVDDKEQGILRVFEAETVPIKVERVFTVVNAWGGAKRGQHAHMKCNQLLCCVSGAVKLICDNGNSRTEIMLKPDSEAVLVPNGVWAEQEYLQDKSVIIVFCDQPYDEDDYIRDYGEYLHWKREHINQS